MIIIPMKRFVKIKCPRKINEIVNHWLYGRVSNLACISVQPSTYNYISRRRRIDIYSIHCFYDCKYQDLGASRSIELMLKDFDGNFEWKFYTFILNLVWWWFCNKIEILLTHFLVWLIFWVSRCLSSDYVLYYINQDSCEKCNYRPSAGIEPAHSAIDLSPFEWNFDLDKSGQKFHHSLKEHHKISNISFVAKFCKMRII
jgi:hypothetical protein